MHTRYCWSDLRQVNGFLRVLRFPPAKKTDRHDITEILLKGALNTTKPNQCIAAITFIRYTQSKQIGNANEKQVQKESKKTKETGYPKVAMVAYLRILVLIIIILFETVNFNNK